MKLLPLLFLILGILQFVVASNRTRSDEFKASLLEISNQLENIEEKIVDYNKQKDLLNDNFKNYGEDTYQAKNISDEKTTTSEIDDLEGNPSIHKVDSDEHYPPSEIEITEIDASAYNFRFSYALSFPTDTDFREYQMEYEWGHHLEAKFYRKWEKFFFGLSLGSKIFQNKSLTIPYSPGRLELPASGSNYSVFSSITVGIDHFLNNNTFITGSVGLGAGMAWDEIEMGGVEIFSDNDYFLYAMAQFGIGYAFNERFSMLFYYQLDAQGSRNYFDTQFFQQLGLSAGIHF